MTQTSHTEQNPSKVILGRAAWKVVERCHWNVAGPTTTWLSQHGASAVGECRNRGIVTVDKAAGTATLTDLGRQVAEIVWGTR
jgi:hypothetical protein